MSQNLDKLSEHMLCGNRKLPKISDQHMTIWACEISKSQEIEKNNFGPKSLEYIVKYFSTTQRICMPSYDLVPNSGPLQTPNAP